VAVASLLNATLVIPEFLYSNVWKDPRYDVFGTELSLVQVLLSPFYIVKAFICLFTPVDLNVNDEKIIHKQLRNVI